MLRGLWLLPISALLLTGLAQGQKKPVTLEALKEKLGPSYATDIQWRPDSAGFTYKRDEQYHYFDAGSGKSKALAATRDLTTKAVSVPEALAFEWENRGVRERSSQWCSDSRHVLLSSGGDLFWVDTRSDAVTQLTRTLYAEADPQLSADCKQISFRKDYDLYVLERENGAVRALTTGGTAERSYARLDWVYPEELGLPTAHWWSPDSKRIALLQFDVSETPQYPHGDYLALPPRAEPERYPKAGEANASVRLAIVSTTDAKLRFVQLGDPTKYLLARVEWLPDGKTVAVQRLNRIQNELQLIFVNAETLETEVILTEKESHWINISDDFRFLPKLNAFLWSSENTGHRHLYLYYMKDRYARQLTDGQWDVLSVAGVNEAETEAYLISTRKSALERQVEVVLLHPSTDSSEPPAAPRSLSTEEGTWSADFSPNGARWVGKHSSDKQGAVQMVMDTAGKKSLTLTERDTKIASAYDVLPSEFHTVKAADGTTLHGRLIRPAGFEAGKQYPVIVGVYGGPHAQSVSNAWRGLNMDQVYAHAGYVVWQLDNRGTSGRGHQFEVAVSRKLGIVELEDQLAGIAYLKGLGFADEKRIGVTGWSYGGFMTLNCLLNAPDVFRAGISGAPVVDWRFYDTIYTERYMDVPSANADGYAKTSLIPKAGQLKGSLLLIHNLWDDNVHFQNALHMMDALQQAGKRFDLMVYPQKTHGVTGKHAEHMREMMLRFFDRELK